MKDFFQRPDSDIEWEEAEDRLATIVAWLLLAAALVVGFILGVAIALWVL